MMQTRTSILIAALVGFLIAHQHYSLIDIQIALAARLLDIAVSMFALALITLFAGNLVRRSAMIFTMLGTVYLLLTILIGGANAW